MERMGARVGLFRRRFVGGEPMADIEVRPAELVAADVTAEHRAVTDRRAAAAGAAGELCPRHHDHPRGGRAAGQGVRPDPTVVDAALNAIGAHVRGLDDGFEVRGVPTRLRGGEIDAAGDHRIAMLGAIAGACSQSGVTIEGCRRARSQLP